MRDFVRNSIVGGDEVRPSRNLLKSFLFEAAAWALVVAYVYILGPFLLMLLLVPLVFVVSDLDGKPVPRVLLALIFLFTPLISLVLGAPIMWWTKVLATFFLRIRRRARRYRLSADRELAKDKRAPVLYLRPFSDDEQERAERLSRRTDEEILVSALKGIGPVITIGRPDEELPLLGAIRIYCADGDWQGKVNELISKSQMLAINAGTSPGILWELNAAVRSAGPSKILISLIPWESLDRNTRQRRYDYFRKLAEGAMKNALGDQNLTLPETVDDSLALTLTPNWSADVIRPGRLKKFFFSLSLSTLFRETVRPVLMSRGIYMQRSASEVIRLAILVLGMISPLVWGLGIFLVANEAVPRNLGVLVVELGYGFMFFTYSFVIKNQVTALFERRRQKKTLVSLEIN